MAFLTDQDFENLPEDDRDAFTALEALSRERLYQAERDREGDITWSAMVGYMNEIAALAKSYALDDVTFDRNPDNPRNEFEDFTLKVEYAISQIRVERTRRRKKASVALSSAGRQKIQHHLERIKTEISESTLPEKRKKRLLEKLATFESELTKARTELWTVMAFVALVTSTTHVSRHSRRYADYD